MSDWCAKVKWHSRVYSNTTVRLIPLQHVRPQPRWPSWVKGGRYLNNITADQVYTRNIAQNDGRLPRNLAQNGRPRTGGDGGIQTINVKCQIGWVIPKDTFDLVCDIAGLFSCTSRASIT